MRLAMLSDIHGNIAALEAVVADFKRRDVDGVVNLGDNLSGPLFPKETAEFLMAQSWTHLAGNHERQLLNFEPETAGPSDAYTHSQLTGFEFSWMATLRHSFALNGEIFLCHGTPESDAEYFLETVETDRVRLARPVEIRARLGDVGEEIVVCGHSHVPRSIRAKTGQLIVNPGSVGLQAYDDDRPHYHIMETGSPDARYAIVERAAGRWSVQLITVPYNFRPMAQQAKRRGRNDWKNALLFGYMVSEKK